MESRNIIFIETPPNLLPAARRLSPQQDIESPSYDFSDDTLDDNYVSHDDMLRGGQNYTSTLDFGVDTPAGRVELLLPQQASPGVTSPGGASPARISPEGITPEGSSSPPAPAPAPGPAPIPASAAPRVTNGHANRGAVGVTPVFTRSRAASLFPVPFATRYGVGHNNTRATLVELFEAGTLQRLSKLQLRPSCYTKDIVHLAENANVNIEYAYVATNALGSFSGWRTRNKSRTPSRRRWPSHKRRVGRWLQTRRSRVWKSMACTSCYPSLRFRTDETSSVPAGYTRSRQTEYTRADWSCWVVTSPRDPLRGYLFPRVQAPEHPDGTCNRRAAGLRGLHAGRASSISQH